MVLSPVINECFFNTRRDFVQSLGTVYGDAVLSVVSGQGTLRVDVTVERPIGEVCLK